MQGYLDLGRVSELCKVFIRSCFLVLVWSLCPVLCLRRAMSSSFLVDFPSLLVALE